MTTITADIPFIAPNGVLTVTATYSGGPYINIAWHGYPAPFEVINIWNHSTGAPNRRVQFADDLRGAVIEWFESFGDTVEERRAELLNFHRNTA